MLAADGSRPTDRAYVVRQCEDLHGPCIGFAPDLFLHAPTQGACRHAATEDCECQREGKVLLSLPTLHRTLYGKALDGLT
jgi:hypothetical protein